MRRNTILVSILTLLLSITAAVWVAPSVARDASKATEHTAAVGVIAHRREQRIARRAVRASVLQPLPIDDPSPVIHPAVDQPMITEHHQRLATAVLNALPSGCRDHLQNFSVLYQGATRRGLGGKTTIILDGSVPDAEFVALLTHECGHVISGNLLGSADTAATLFRDGGDVFYENSPVVAFWRISWTTATTKLSVAHDSDFVSGYAKSDAFEDFAETITAYALQRDMLRDRAEDNAALAAKLQWMETYLPLPEDPLGNGAATWTGTVPWDTTRLPYALSNAK